MEAKELRISNLIFNPFKEEIEIDEIKKNRIGYKYHIFFCEEIEPIPLTEEWLLKFGFLKLNNIEYEYEDLYINWFEKRLSIMKINFFYRGDLPKYIHQLQNLYFELTGEKLTIK